ncbi:TetR family transcriptional regulator [Breoghania sp.]|uniref:TetR family transcriptional regulator n=1 Tax=Breoghania sp. TaxID=2065378 RepID=UPI0026175777|nr:TetR family transcriptional regulator [Breoghania sp.]MDJ0931869.1 TetR family transcriptional regulator [Breoghania sp.]
MSTKDTPPRPGRPATIRDAAAALFAAKGYDGTSLQDVTSAVGVTKAGRALPLLLHQAGSVRHDRARRPVRHARLGEGACGEGGDAGRAGRRLHGRASAYFEANRNPYRAAFIGRGGDLYVFTPEQMAARRAYTDFLTAILEEGRAQGAFVFDDAPLTTRGILGMLNWMTR